MSHRFHKAVAATTLLLPAIFAYAGDESIGTIKTLKGDVLIEREGQALEAAPGQKLFSEDSLRTGSDSAAGILFLDDTRISIGANTKIDLDRFNFDRSTHEGDFNVSMKEGTLSAIAGKLTEKRPGAMTIKTPSAILAVRGTEFSIKVAPTRD